MTLRQLLLIFFAVPWLIRSSFRFRVRNSKFGNSRFFYAGSNKSAYWCFLKCVLITAFTTGLFFPVAVWLYKRECLNQLYAGQLNADWPAYMRAMYMPVFLFIGAMALLTPWAAIRLYKYQAESLKLVLIDHPDHLINQQQQEHSAIAEELSDIFDLDIAL